MSTTTYQTPGVHVQEVPPAPGPIQGASTNVAAFVGLTVGGPPPGTVRVVTSYRQFAELFAVDGKLPVYDVGLNMLANGVYGFFDNGGTRCYVTRASCMHEKDTIAGKVGQWFGVKAAEQWLAKNAVDLVSGFLAGHGQALKADRQKRLQAGLQAALQDMDLPTRPAQAAPLQDALWNWLDESLADLESTPRSALKELLKGASKRWAEDLWLKYRAKSLADLNSAEYDIGKALAALEPFTDISIVAAPGLTGENHWRALITHCTDNAPNCFAVLDAPQGADWANQDNQPIYPSSQLPNDSDYAAIYYPWIQVVDAGSGQKIYAPPSGHIAGVYARVDAQRGVFKAPANESVYGALALETYVSDNQQKYLNNPGSQPNGDGVLGINVNCIRQINGGILVWGARTLQVDENEQFKYVSTRRTYNYIRQSLESGTQWAVFEPNTQALWGQLTRNVTSFLTRLWQEGGLFGSTAAEAFYVKCDADTNPESVRDAGEVVTEVGVAITKPAEFVVFQLGLTSGSATPTTSA